MAVLGVAVIIDLDETVIVGVACDILTYGVPLRIDLEYTDLLAFDLVIAVGQIWHDKELGHAAI